MWVYLYDKSILTLNILRMTSYATWFPYRGRKYDLVLRFCRGCSPQHTRKCLCLPVENWEFQGRRLSSSFWLCWGRGLRWFSSSLFLGRGCNRREKCPYDDNWLSVTVNQCDYPCRGHCEWMPFELPYKSGYHTVSHTQISVALKRPLISTSINVHTGSAALSLPLI